MLMHEQSSYSERYKKNQDNIIYRQQLQNQPMLMNNHQSSISSPVIQKIDSDLSHFRGLLSNLRFKDKRKHDSLCNDSSLSFIEPQSERPSFDSQIPFDRSFKNFLTNLPPNPHLRGDPTLKYKPRAGVNGRTDLKLKSHTYAYKQILESLEKAKQTKYLHKQSYFQEEKDKLLKKEAFPASRALSSNNYKSESIRMRRKSHIGKISKTKLNNPQALSPIKLSVEDFVHSIEPKILLQYLQKQPYYILQDSEPNTIYTFFISICTKFRIKSYFEQPLIKRYRNCVYFGQKVLVRQSSHLGFVWYYRKAIYYGQFLGGKKNGYGIQIDFENGCNFIWKGTFVNGKKLGFFQLITPDIEYKGMVRNSLFDGEGLLKTKKSIYQGNFIQGMKHGHGTEEFAGKNLRYTGEYFENMFHGKGQMESTSYFYNGEWKKNKIHGNGFQRTEQFEYIGSFMNGKKEGKGILKMKDGSILEGYFAAGKLVQHYSGRKEEESGQYIKSIPIESNIKKPPLSRSGGKVRFQKYLSKDLAALYEENEECTIDYQNRFGERISGRPMNILEIDYGENSSEHDEEDPLENKANPTIQH